MLKLNSISGILQIYFYWIYICCHLILDTLSWILQVSSKIQNHQPQKSLPSYFSLIRWTIWKYRFLIVFFEVKNWRSGAALMLIVVSYSAVSLTSKNIVGCEKIFFWFFLNFFQYVFYFSPAFLTLKFSHSPNLLFCGCVINYIW